MPEQSLSKIRKTPQAMSPSAISGDGPAYAELHCKTNFSFLLGGSHADELVQQAKAQGYTALAITDQNTVAGVVRAHIAAKDAGLKLLIGAELSFEDAPPVVVWVSDRAAYGRLCRLLTIGRRRAEKGACKLFFSDLAGHAEGLIAGVLLRNAIVRSPNRATVRFSDSEEISAHAMARRREGNAKLEERAFGAGELLQTDVDRQIPCPTLPFFAASRLRVSPIAIESIPQPSVGADDFRAAVEPLTRYRELFRDRCYALIELSRGPDDRQQLQAMVQLGKKARLPIVVANDVVYHVPERRPLQDMLTCIREGCTVAEAGEKLFGNADRHLRDREELAELFAEYPEAIRRTVEIADRCQFNLEELKYEYPEELAPEGLTPFEHLRRLAWAGARGRYPHGVPQKARTLIEHELDLIAKMKFEPYFLTVWDLVRFARTRGILCQGRGSAANSVICYCLGVTAVDPDRVDLLFERFVSEERNEAPDIDIDFEHERREEVLQYIYDKYGRDRAGMTAVVNTYRPRSAVRDIGKALGYSLAQVDQLAKAIEMRGDDAPLEIRFKESGFDPAEPRARQLIVLVRELVGFPRHLSQHTGGMVMTRGPLCELSPIENAAMPGRTVIQWDKDDLDSLGILKVDCLCLGMLTAIRKSFQMIAKTWGLPLGLATLPPEDPEVYAMIQKADTIGVFQIESRAQMSMLPRLKPASFYDLVIEVAIVRPGPIQGDMVHPYLRRREGSEPVDYPNEAVRGVLSKTLGVPLFQEQAMKLAVVAAGFTPGEADQLRRAMGAWRRPGIIDQFHKKLIDGMHKSGIDADYAERVYKQICGFGEYGFPESHAASFALLVYVSCWLKRYFPEAFTAGVINSLPMGFYAPAQLIRDAKNHGVEVLPIDVNFSEWNLTLSRRTECQSVVPRKIDLRSVPDRGTGCQPVQTSQPSTENPETQQSQKSPREFEISSAAANQIPNAASQSSDLRFQISDPKSEISDPKFQISNFKSENSNSASAFFSASSASSGFQNSPFLLPVKKDGAAIRLGYRLIAGLSEKDADKIAAAREHGPFLSVEDFARRTRVGQPVVARLARANAFGSVSSDRRASLWQSLAEQEKPPLFADLIDDADTTPLAPMEPVEEVLADYRMVGLSLVAHPISFCREQLKRLRVVSAEELKTACDNSYLRVGGLVLMRQQPQTARGIRFITLEDETGIANLVVRPQVWDRFRKIAHNAQALLAHGRLERRGEIIHVLVNRLDDLTTSLAGLKSKSRDFR